jgi:hypothetical protein
MVCCGAGGQICVVVLCRRIGHCHWRGDQFSGARNVGLAGGAGEQSVVADAMEPLGQNVEQEAPDELAGRERHRAKPLPVVAAVVLAAEGYAALVKADQAAVLNGNAVGVPGEIGEHRFGPGEG